MDLYVVTCEGVYRHGIMGIYNNLVAACNRAWECWRAEFDNYHEFDVTKITLNLPGVDGEHMLKVGDNLAYIRGGR